MENNYKLYKNIREDSSSRIARDIREKQARENYVHKDPYDKNIFEKGMEWFNSGLALEDAPDEIKNNSNFSAGFEKGRRLAYIEILRNEEEPGSGKSRG